MKLQLCLLSLVVLFTWNAKSQENLLMTQSQLETCVENVKGLKGVPSMVAPFKTCHVHDRFFVYLKEQDSKMNLYIRKDERDCYTKDSKEDIATVVNVNELFYDKHGLTDYEIDRKYPVKWLSKYGGMGGKVYAFIVRMIDTNGHKYYAAVRYSYIKKRFKMITSLEEDDAILYDFLNEMYQESN